MITAIHNIGIYCCLCSLIIINLIKMNWSLILDFVKMKMKQEIDANILSVFKMLGNVLSCLEPQQGLQAEMHISSNILLIVKSRASTFSINAVLCNVNYILWERERVTRCFFAHLYGLSAACTWARNSLWATLLTLNWLQHETYESKVCLECLFFAFFCVIWHRPTNTE